MSHDLALFLSKERVSSLNFLSSSMMSAVSCESASSMFCEALSMCCPIPSSVTSASSRSPAGAFQVALNISSPRLRFSSCSPGASAMMGMSARSQKCCQGAKRCAPSGSGCCFTICFVHNKPLAVLVIADARQGVVRPKFIAGFIVGIKISQNRTLIGVRKLKCCGSGGGHRCGDLATAQSVFRVDVFCAIAPAIMVCRKNQIAHDDDDIRIRWFTNF